MVATRNSERAARAAAEHNATTGILALPSELLERILWLIPLAPTLLNAASVCKAFRDAVTVVLRQRPFPWQADQRVRTGRYTNITTLAADGAILVGEDYGVVSEYSHDLVRIRGTDDHDSWNRDTFLGRDIIGIAPVGNGSWFLEADAEDNLELWLDADTCDSSGGGCDLKCLARVDAHRVVVGQRNNFRIMTYEFAFSERFQELRPVDCVWGPQIDIGDYVGEVPDPHVHDPFINQVAVTPDGTHIITGDSWGRVKAWKVDALECVGANKLLWQGVVVLAAMPDSKRFLASSGHKLPDHLRGTVELFDVENCARLRVFYDLQPVLSTALLALPDNRHALSAEEEIKLFDVETGEVLRTFPAVPDHPDDADVIGEKDVLGLVSLPDTLRFVSVTRNGVLSTYAHGLRPVA